MSEYHGASGRRRIDASPELGPGYDWDAVNSMKSSHATPFMGSDSFGIPLPESGEFQSPAFPGQDAQFAKLAYGPAPYDFPQPVQPPEPDMTPSGSIARLRRIPGALPALDAFCKKLHQDLSAMQVDSAVLRGNIGYVKASLEAFGRKLHGESSDEADWETSVLYHEYHSYITDKLLIHFSMAKNDGKPAVKFLKKMTRGDISQVTSSGAPSNRGQTKDHFGPKPVKGSSIEPGLQFRAVPAGSARLQAAFVGASDIGTKSIPPPQAESWRFIQDTKAYRWLLSKIEQLDRLSYNSPTAVTALGKELERTILQEWNVRRLSRLEASLKTALTIKLDWDPREILTSDDTGLTPIQIIEGLICLTGTGVEAQATTMREYMKQTWPGTAEHVISLMRGILVTPKGSHIDHKITFTREPEPSVEGVSPKRIETAVRVRIPLDMSSIDSRCTLYVTGDVYFVSEVAEQMAWLAAILTLPPRTSESGTWLCCPTLEFIAREGPLRLNVIEETFRISRQLKFMYELLEGAETLGQRNGLCWSPLFLNPVILNGYPILKRSQLHTGLEVTLPVLAQLVRSKQVVQLGSSIMIKGFDSLLVATSASVGATLWHLIRSDTAGDRVSYVDPRIDQLRDVSSPHVSLDKLGRNRHFVGWCANAMDCCGHETATVDILPSGLPPTPGSIVIDRLYIEAGSDFLGGLTMALNQKEHPVWLEREKDYPSLLNWVGLQPIIFYDVSDRRAWLADGASALLHMVRMSLRHDQNRQDSAYDWVFNPSKFTTTEDNTIVGRQAAIETLKIWENLNLDLYVTSKYQTLEGTEIIEHAKLEARVKKILHAMEILIDVQSKSASRDGIWIPQTFRLGKGLVGFDLMDVLCPLGPVSSRVQHINLQHIGMRGGGWRDFAEAASATTLFGNGFGDLIVPSDSSTVCSKWTTVPVGFDYLASSISTLQLIYQTRLMRIAPSMPIGQVTKTRLWMSPVEPLQSCCCVGSGQTCDVHPVQYLTTKRSWEPRRPSVPLKPVDIMSLKKEGAVIFGHGSSTGIARRTKKASRKNLGSNTTGKLIQLSQVPESSQSSATGAGLASLGSQSGVREPQITPSTSAADSEERTKRGKSRLSWLGLS